MSILAKIALNLLIKFLSKQIGNGIQMVKDIQDEITKAEKLQAETELAMFFRKELKPEMLDMFALLSKKEKVGDLKLAIVKKAIQSKYGEHKYINTIIELLLLRK